MDIEVSSSLAGSDGRPLPYINNSDIPSAVINENADMREIANTLSRWVDNARAATGRTSMFDRGAFTPPDNPYEEMRAARTAMKYDSLVSGIAEVTEAFAFQGVKWESANPDEADVFNQLSRDMNLDAVIRSMWQEEFTYSQVVVAKLWDWTEYTVRGTTKNGNQRKRKYRLWAPLQMRVLDSAKVVPVGTGPLAGEQLAWQATMGEIGAYQAAAWGQMVDPLMLAFFQGAYQPSYMEASQLAALGVDTTRLLAVNPEWVFRHTITKPDYQRFADVRLKSCFSLLDLKRQLMQSDRAMLIGAANYILLIRKGLKDEPAQAVELTNLKENYNFIAKMPVIISDHRLSIDIIAPKTDFTLDSAKYDVLDSRLLARLLGTLSLGGKGQRNETQETISYAVARTMENRRHMLKRTLEIELARAVVNHPKNRSLFDTEPNLVFTPRQIALSMDPSYVSGLLALRTQREISRDTILEFFGLDEGTEAQRMEMEAEMFDDIFRTFQPYAGQPTPPGASPSESVPPATPPVSEKPETPNNTPEAPGVSGRRGGRPVGGGQSPQSPQAIAKPRTPRGNPKTGK
jgi:hypothetical protein